MTDTPAPTNPDNPRLDDARRRAIDAAMAVFERGLRLYAPHRHLVVEALDAASDVMTDFEVAEADRQMREAGFAGMDVIGVDATIRLKHATDFARVMVMNFDEFTQQRGCENYTETEFTITDPATEQAAAAGLPVEQWPPHRRYTFIVVKPGGKTPHQLRQQAEARVAELEEQLCAVQDQARKALCQEIYNLAGNLPALKMLVADAGAGDDGEMSVSRARALLRSLASLGGVLDPPDDEWPEELLNARVRVWFCPARSQHPDTGGPTVEWGADGVARCLAQDCDLTSADTLAARRFFDTEQAPGLLDSGTDEDVVADLRRSYVRDVCTNPEALRQLREIAGREARPR